MAGGWYWDERRGKRRRHRPGIRKTGRRLFQVGATGLAGVAALAADGAAVLAMWDTAIGVLLVALAAITWWGLATARELRCLEGRGVGSIPDYTVTPVQAARMEHADDVGAAFGIGGGDSGGGGGGT